MYIFTCGLVVSRNNKICDELLSLAQRAFTLASVQYNLLIRQVRTKSEKEIRQGSDKDKETRVDVMIQVLWYQQVKAIIEVKLGDSDVG